MLHTITLFHYKTRYLFYIFLRFFYQNSSHTYKDISKTLSSLGLNLKYYTYIQNFDQNTLFLYETNSPMDESNPNKLLFNIFFSSTNCNIVR